MSPLLKIAEILIPDIWKRIDRQVEGRVRIIKSKNGKKYAIPSSHEDLYWPSYDPIKHGMKKEDYKDVGNLVRDAREALKAGHAEAFYLIFCILAELKKANQGSVCCCGGDDLKQLDYKESKGELKKLGNLISSDKQSINSLKKYAKVMENLLSSPFGGFKLGGGTAFNAIPMIGACITLVMNLAMCYHSHSRVSAPGWLFKQILFPILWAFFFAFAIPTLGSAAASRVSPSRRAARKIKFYLLLRCVLMFDQEKPDGTRLCLALSYMFKEFTGGKPVPWQYNDDFLKEIFGKDLIPLYKEQKKKIKEAMKRL